MGVLYAGGNSGKEINAVYSMKDIGGYYFPLRRIEVGKAGCSYCFYQPFQF